MTRTPEQGPVVDHDAPWEAALLEEDVGGVDVGAAPQDQGGFSSFVPGVVWLQVGVGEQQVEHAPADHGFDRRFAAEGERPQLVAHFAALEVHASQLADPAGKSEQAAQLPYLHAAPAAHRDDGQARGPGCQQGIDEACRSTPEQVAPRAHERAVDVDVERRDPQQRGAGLGSPPVRRVGRVTPAAA